MVKKGTQTLFKVNLKHKINSTTSLLSQLGVTEIST